MFAMLISRFASNTSAQQPEIAERITIALIPKVVREFQRLQQRTSLSRTDLANRAITLYEYIDAQQQAGCEVLIRNPSTGATQAILIM